MPKIDQLTLDCVRTYIEEHLPDDAEIVEKSMFGCTCWCVRGHIFLALKYSGQRLLVRVGKENIAKALTMDGASTGPIQSVFVDAPHFHGNDRLKRWYAQALAFNVTLPTKQPDEQAPGKKRRRRAEE